VSSLYRLRWLFVKSTRRTDARERLDCAVCSAIVARPITLPTQVPAPSASRSRGAVLFPSHRRGGSLGPTTSKRTHRLGTRTSPQVARLGPIIRDGSPAADPRLGGGRRRPPDRQVDARAFLAYASLWHTANDSKGVEGPTLAPSKGPSVRGVPEGLAHHTGSSQKVSLTTLLQTALAANG